MSQIHVEFTRPEQRFGWSAVVWRDDPFTGRRMVLQIGPDGERVWVDVDPSAGGVVPTYLFDDEVIEALAAAWSNLVPTPAVDPGVPDVLRDSLDRERVHADRLYELLDRETKR